VGEGRSTARKREYKHREAAECFTQRLDKNSKTAAENAGGSRTGPSWLTF
jgi:hypothetical protein